LNACKPENKLLFHRNIHDFNEKMIILEDNIKLNLMEKGYEGERWIKLAQSCVQWLRNSSYEIVSFRKVTNLN
jgi:hypothetical protein